MKLLKRKKAVEKQPTSNYDPNKIYEWERDQEFTITGNDLDNINKLLFSIISTPEAQIVIKAVNTYNDIQAIIAKNVETGAIREKVED